MDLYLNQKDTQNSNSEEHRQIFVFGLMAAIGISTIAVSLVGILSLCSFLITIHSLAEDIEVVEKVK